jgi:methionyl-tRNA synthetase
MLNKYRTGIVPAVATELQADAEQAVAKAGAHLRAHELQAALVATWELVNRANLYVEQTQPFRMAKDPAQAAQLDAVLYNLVESCRILAVMLAPFLPDTARRIYQQLRLEGSPADWSQTRWGVLQPSHQVGSPEPLFPRRDLVPKEAKK